MNRTKSTFTGCILGLGLVLAAGQAAHATTAVWDSSFTPSGWTRGSTPGSLYAEWNVFNNDGGGANIVDTTPDVGNFGGGTYNVTETTGAAFLTGGNIYSFAAPTAFDFTAGNVAGGPRNVYLRLASLGNYDSTLKSAFTNFTLNGITGTYTELFNEVGSFAGQTSVETEGIVSWLNVPSSSSFLLKWNAIGSSVSLDQLSLDVGPVAPVPLPAAAYLMASGLMGIATMARRKLRAV
ncbi:MAG TPA: VPLPA-CTERM sorting domain-containing protein [Nitrospira sp.]|nr:VPLPA-CTERM sorting domain-containing protein [Nitrospira sp.]